jgi:hypothetical protein
MNKQVDLSKIRDLNLDHVEVRDVNADDMMDAAARCVPPDGGALDGNIFNLAMRSEMLAQAIVSFTPRSGENAGRKVIVTGSCRESLDWNSRTREFVGEIFDYLNGVSRQEREDFQKALATSPSTAGSPDAARAE